MSFQVIYEPPPIHRCYDELLKELGEPRVWTEHDYEWQWEIGTIVRCETCQKAYVVDHGVLGMGEWRRASDRRVRKALEKASS